MIHDRICPLCGTINKGLDLQDSKGLYECEKCGTIVHTSYWGHRQIRQIIEIRDKGRKVYDGR